MKFADLHCDTPFELFRAKENIISNNLHISLDKSDYMEQYVQVAAVWSDYAKNNDTCYNDFFDVCGNFKEQVNGLICYNSSQLKKISKTAFVLAVEDARLLNMDINRLYTLKDAGVKLMTLTWKNTSCVGGAWNTNVGLTNFGNECVSEMLNIGIIPDVSHGSQKLLQNVYSISKRTGKPFCATHSNSYTICGHHRNLTDDDAKLIAECGGVIGVSLCPKHLSSNVAPDIHDIISHIDHHISVVGEDCVALGCDFDGISSLPTGISDITSIKHIFSAACHKFGVRIAEKIFFNNAYYFLLNNI